MNYLSYFTIHCYNAGLEMNSLHCDEMHEIKSMDNVSCTIERHHKMKQIIKAIV